VFTGLVYRGGTTIALHRDLESIPVLAPAGAILPLVAEGGDLSATANPDALELRVYAGADGELVLAEEHDDSGRWAETRYTFAGGEVRIHPVEGDVDAVPGTRRYDVVLCGFADVTGVEVDGHRVDVAAAGPGSVLLRLPSVTAADGAVLRLLGDTAPAGNRDVPERLFTLLDRAQLPLATKEAVHRVVTTQDAPGAAAGLAALQLPRPLHDAVVELLLADPGA
jgi:hypothetical protein